MPRQLGRARLLFRFEFDSVAGFARFSRDAYLALDPKKRVSVVAFLHSLVIEPP